MPMPVQQFQRGPGVLAGISAGQNIMQRLLTDPTQKSLLQAQLQRQQLLAQEQQEKLKTLPQTLQAQLALAQAQPAFTEAQTAFTQAGVPLRGQQTRLTAAEVPLTQEKTRLMPITAATQLYSARVRAGQLAQAQRGQAASELRALGYATRGPIAAKIIEQSPQAAEAMGLGLTQSLQGIVRPPGQAAPIPLPQILQKFAGEGTPRVAPTGAVAPPGALPGGDGGALTVAGLGGQLGRQAITQPTSAPVTRAAPTIETPTPTQPLQTTLTPSQIKAIQTTAGAQSVHQTTTANIQNQSKRAVSAGRIWKNLIYPILPDITAYVGPLGAALKAGDKLKAIEGRAPERYQQYTNFVNEFAIPFAEEVRMSLGGGATDKETEHMLNLVKREEFFSNPEVAMKNLLALHKLLQTQAGALALGAGEVRQSLLEESLAPPAVLPTAPSKTAGLVPVITPDGKSGSIPRDQLGAALKAGYRRAS